MSTSSASFAESVSVLEDWPGEVLAPAALQPGEVIVVEDSLPVGDESDESSSSENEKFTHEYTHVELNQKRPRGQSRAVSDESQMMPNAPATTNETLHMLL